MNLNKFNQRRGASLILVTALFVVMMIFSYMAINIANIQRNQVASQVSTDLASRWGVDMLSRTTDTNAVEDEVRDLIHRNWTVTDESGNWLADNQANIDINIEFGTAVVAGNDISFQTGMSPINAVRVGAGTDIDIFGFQNGSQIKELGIARDSTAIALERDICLVVDRSGSMNWDLNTGTWSYDNSWHSYNALSTSNYWYYEQYAYQWWWYWPHPTNSRWASMIPAVYGLADEFEETEQNEKFAIVSYSTDGAVNWYDHNLNVQYYDYPAAGVEADMTFDYETAAYTLDNKYKWEHPVTGGTSISAGIDEAVNVLTGSTGRPNAYKTMIVMTDGQHNTGRSPQDAAADAADAGIEVFTVTFSIHADQVTMQETATNGNGRHFHAPDGDSLEEVFREIANIPPAAFID